MIIVVIVSAPVRREPPSSSSFPAARVVDTTCEPIPSNVVPLRDTLRKAV